ncbi:MAG: hypothetical protein ACRC1K_25420, partial [Planctomycetia bacterium]
AEPLAVDGVYETRLEARIDLTTESGTPVVGYALDVPVDRCGVRRRDFYCHFSLTAPSRLDGGPHRLRVRLRDAVQKIEAEASLSVTVVAEPQGPPP